MQRSDALIAFYRLRELGFSPPALWADRSAEEGAADQWVEVIGPDVPRAVFFAACGEYKRGVSTFWPLPGQIRALLAQPELLVDGAQEIWAFLAGATGGPRRRLPGGGAWPHVPRDTPHEAFLLMAGDALGPELVPAMLAALAAVGGLSALRSADSTSSGGRRSQRDWKRARAIEAAQASITQTERRKVILLGEHRQRRLGMKS